MKATQAASGLEGQIRWQSISQGDAAAEMQAMEWFFTFIWGVSTSLAQSCHELLSGMRAEGALFRTEEKHFLAQHSTCTTWSHNTADDKNWQVGLRID